MNNASESNEREKKRDTTMLNKHALPSTKNELPLKTLIQKTNTRPTFYGRKQSARITGKCTCETETQAN